MSENAAAGHPDTQGAPLGVSGAPVLQASPGRPHTPATDRAEGRRECGRASEKQAHDVLVSPAASATPEPDAPGLVICAKTGREFSLTTADQGIWSPAFPSAELVHQAAEFLPERDNWDGHEGPRPRILIAPGSVTITWPDAARRERTIEREQKRRRIHADEMAAYFAEHGEFPEDPEPSRVIMGWSRKSRANFVHRLCQLDYAPMLSDPFRIGAMVTLTYPGDWLTVVPTGQVAKEQLKAFRKRYERAWGETLRTIWKLEFQRRGAPHFHILLVPPHGRAGEHRAGKQRAAVGDGLQFRQWLSAVWADIVAHPDPVQRMKHEAAGTGLDFAEGLRASDPRRVAVYFLKHGQASAKEYQHIVPEAWQEPGKGPGRFWGYWGLEPVVAGREVEPGTAVQAARILRRWAASQGTTRQVRVQRVDTKTGRVRYRSVRRPVRRLSAGAGWVAVNDGAAFGSALARALSL